MQGIVLAAGKGSRLGALTERIPKALIEVDGRPLVSYAIALLRALGIHEIIVVGGCHFEVLQDYIASKGEEILIIENKRFEWESLTSLEAALQHIHGPFLQIDVDFVYSWELVDHIRGLMHQRGIQVFGTPARYMIPDDMVKIKSRPDGTVAEMAKDLKDFNYGYTGMMSCDKENLEVLTKTVQGLLEAPLGKSERVWSMLPKLAQKGGRVAVADIDEYSAVEVDETEDIKKAERFIKEHTEDVSKFFVDS